MKRRDAQTTGFTLLEVLIALAIFVGSAAVLSRLVLLGIENAQYAQWQSEALMIAQAEFAELDAGILTLDDAGTFVPEDYQDWECTLEVGSTAIEGLMTVVITVENISDGPANGISMRLARLYFDESAIATTTTDEETAP